MKIFYLTRYNLTDMSKSVISIGDEIFKSFGLPYRENKNNISCISDGLHEVFVDTKKNGNYRSVVEVRPFTYNGYTREQCQFHYSTNVNNLAGCEGMYSIEDENRLMQKVLKDGYTHVLISTINN